MRLGVNGGGGGKVSEEQKEMWAKVHQLKLKHTK